MKEDIWRRIPSENAHSSMQCPPSPAFQLRSMTKHIFISSHQRWDVLLKPGELFWDSPMESPQKEIDDGIRTVSVTHQVCCITNEVGKRAVLLWNYSFLLKDEPHTHTHTHCIIKLTNTEYHLVYYSLIIAERKRFCIAFLQRRRQVVHRQVSVYEKGKTHLFESEITSVRNIKFLQLKL